jgi:glucose/arabinose dehydrogenase
MNMKHRRSSSWGVAIALAVIAAGCSSDSSDVAVSDVGGTTTTPAATTTPSPAESSPATAAPSTAAPADTSTGGATTPPAAPLGDPAVALTEIDGFSQPVEVSWRPTDGMIYVVEQDGLVEIMSDGRAGPIALDMTSRTAADGERGLLGLAINADGTLAYVDYTDNAGNTQIDEYSVNADGTFDAATRRPVLGFAQPYPNHNGGDLVFGPDHMLYIGTGDGGSGGDPDRRALNLSEWLGKMLRIDPTPTADAGYTVPADNPFVGVDGARPEIWSIGLRNPWRFSFDRSTGDLWIADVGQGQWEEVDAAWAADGGGRGSNFGWSAFEGNHQFNNDQSPDGVTPPIHEYEHVGGACSISGGVLYRGAAIPALVGWYVFADLCTGEVHALQIANRAVAKEVTLGKATNVDAVSEGPDGELYVLSHDGPIFAITPG